MIVWLWFLLWVFIKWWGCYFF